MNRKELEETKPPNHWLSACCATLVWWAIPILVRLQPRSDEVSGGLALGCLIGLAVALSLCASFRRAPWIVLIWIPLFVWTCLAAAKSFEAFRGGPLGGASAAPLEGLATLIILATALLFSVEGVLCLVWHPNTISYPLIALAVLNTAAISFVTPRANLKATQQDIALRILDSSSNPVAGATVTFKRYGYGSGGTDVFDFEGGSLISGGDGVVVIPSRRMRYETRGMISKPSFRDVLFTVGMQFSEWDKERSVHVSTRESGQIAYGTIPTVESVALSIYLPPLSDAPEPLHALKRLTAATDIGRSDEAARFFNIDTGNFSKDPSGDLMFELFFEKDSRFPEDNYEVVKVRVTGLNGTQVLQLPYAVSLSEDLSSYEHIFRIAPESGYHDEIILQDAGSLPGPTIYLKMRGGRIYGRMDVHAWGRSDQKKAPCEVWLYLNPTGQRQLEK